MHDWTFDGVTGEWRCARARLEFADFASKQRTLTAEQVRRLEAPRENEWGPSVGVKEDLEGPGPRGVGRMLQIEMQSGDVIRVWAENVTMA
jgi:hypothetical protein